MKTMQFSTKAGTLEALSGTLSNAGVLPVYRFTVVAFRDNPETVAAGIMDRFSEDYLIVRSSTQSEDARDNSNAGRFKSILNVRRADKDELVRVVREVIASYENPDERDEVFVQPMLRDIKLSGVVLTSDVDTLASYYVINFDDSGSATSVTSGTGSNTQTYIHYKNAPVPPELPYLARICDTCVELERIFNCPYLDIEFAFNRQDALYIFQVRPVAVNAKENLSGIDLEAPLHNIFKKIEGLSEPHPNLLGNRTIFGVMPDWNPAEMIGLRPKQLASSLYKELITDNVWAYQRDNYGYRNLRSHPLLVSFLGIPFIDVRVDFNSFIPKDLNETIARKLVDYYLDKLVATPAHHDKVEFEIIHSCYYLDLPSKLETLRNYGFNANELKRIEFALLELTNRIIDSEHGLYKKDLGKIESLKDKYEDIIGSNLTHIEKIYWLVEDCKRFGTLPFAGIARAAFIAYQFLKSFVELGIITRDELDLFLNSLNTVTRRLNTALCDLAIGVADRDNFLATYGHLRPGTYDILSLRYDENFDSYFSSLKTEQRAKATYEFSGMCTEKIDRALIESGIKTDAVGLLDFIRQAIEGREYAKFIFTKSLSRVLVLVCELCLSKEISREDAAFLDIRTIMALYSSMDFRDIREILVSDIEKNRKSYNYTKAVRLPSLIRKASDVYSFFVASEEPTYITMKKATGRIITEDFFDRVSIAERIVFIRSADPGYDFLFSQNISGLVTQFGGANSHMAIRCAEIGLPAVIGAGEKNFTAWSLAGTLEIDCGNKQVTIIS
jgi:hypothetical protein